MNTFKFNVKFLKPLKHEIVEEMNNFWKERLESSGYKIDSSHGVFHKNGKGKYTRVDYEVCFAHHLDRPMRADVEDEIYEAYKREGFRCHEPWVWQ